MADAEATDNARRTKDDPATAEDGGSRPLATTTGGGLRACVRWAFLLLLAGLIGAMALDIPFNHKALEVTGDSARC